MHKLIQELQRLYLPADSALTPELAAAHLAGDVCLLLDPVDAKGEVRALRVTFHHNADWPRLASLYRQLQEELGLPAPAISVCGRTGYQLWLSLARPQPSALAARFLGALRSRFLGEMPETAIALHPAPDEQVATAPERSELVPGLDPLSGKWSTFIDPSMGSLFIDDGGLESAPNMDAQGELLARLQCIEADAFAAALTLLETPLAGKSANNGVAPGAAPASDAENGAGSGKAAEKLAIGGGFTDPESFLLAVMNDPSVSAKQRIRAAKALLPCFERR